MRRKFLHFPLRFLSLFFLSNCNFPVQYFKQFVLLLQDRLNCFRVRAFCVLTTCFLLTVFSNRCFAQQGLYSHFLVRECSGFQCRNVQVFSATTWLTSCSSWTTQAAFVMTSSTPTRSTATAAASARDGRPSKGFQFCLNPTQLRRQTDYSKLRYFSFMIDIINATQVSEDAAHVSVIKYGNSATISFFLDT